MEHKKFQFKTGMKKVEKEVPTVPPTPPVQPDVAALLNQLIDQKLAAIATTSSAPAPLQVQDKDFEMIEDAVANKEPKKEKAKLKLPKLTKEKPKLEARKLVIEDPEERAEFEQIVMEFNEARSKKNEAMSQEKEDRSVIVAKMQNSLIYEGDKVDVNVKEIPNESVNAEAVFKALIDPESDDIEGIKAGIQQLFDLARLGVIEIGKGNFERWVKGHGYDPKPFMVEHEKERRIYITPK